MNDSDIEIWIIYTYMNIFSKLCTEVIIVVKVLVQNGNDNNPIDTTSQYCRKPSTTLVVKPSETLVVDNT